MHEYEPRTYVKLNSVLSYKHLMKTCLSYIKNILESYNAINLLKQETDVHRNVLLPLSHECPSEAGEN